MPAFGVVRCFPVFQNKTIWLLLANLKVMCRKAIIPFLFILPIFCYSQPSHQDTTAIQEVIIQENRFQIPFDQYNRNLEVLTRQDLADLPARSIQEALRYVSGVDLRQRGPFGTQADIGIDGGTFEQSVVLINGVKLADPQTAHHMLNLPIPLEAIERIEILRGPASRIYGVNSLTGAINIVTKDVDRHAVFAHLYAGSSFQPVEDPGQRGVYYGTGQQVGGTFFQKNHQHQIYLGKERSNGQRYNTASDNERIFYQNQIILDPDHRLQMMAGYINNRFGANGYYAAPGDRESEELVGTFVSSIASQHQIDKHWYLSPRISYRYNQDDYRFYRDDLDKARSLHYTHVLAGEFHTIRQSSIGDFGFGVEGRREAIASSNIGQHARNNVGIFSEYRSGLFDRLLFNIGVYANYNTDYDWQFYPGADVSFRINDRLKLAASSGSAQRIPSFTDLYLDQRPGNLGNPTLVSEHAWQHEISGTFRHQSFGMRGGYFHRSVQDFIDWVRQDPEEPFQAQNMGENRVDGLYASIESSYEFHSKASLSGELSYTYLEASLLKRIDAGQIKYGIDHLKHQAVGRVNIRRGPWQAALVGRLLQRMSSHRYFVADAQISYHWKTWNLYGDIQNIFDAQYLEIGAVPMLGRWANMGIRYQWNIN